MSERYIVMRNWERFQHYRDRSPLWIKNYTELLRDDSYRNLSGHTRAVLHGLWLEYASSRCHLLVNTASLSSRLGLRVSMGQLDSLSHAGFITFSASPPLAERYPRVEKRKNRTLSKDVSSARDESAESENGRSQRQPTEAEIVAERERRERAGYVPNLNQYTGCKYVRGEFALTAKYDPLGTEHPPIDWPYERPTKSEIVEALNA